MIILFLGLNSVVYSQDPNQAVVETKLSRIWGGVAANGDKLTLDFRAGFFPNDYNLLQHRGQGNENYLGSGFRLACTGFTAPDDSLYPAAVFGPINDYILYGDVTRPITNYIRYNYSDVYVNRLPIGINDFGTYDPSQFSGGTYDQIIESTYKNVVGVEVNRKLLFWSQSFNDNYVIIEVELTNVGVDHVNQSGDTTVVQDTLHNFYFNMSMGNTNNYYSVGISPTVPDRPNYGYLWQHYYGARPGDSMRVFYFYNADDPQKSGDDMGAPQPTQNGRLMFTDISFYSILHASQNPFLDPSQDVDDFLQPKVTYIGTETRIPNPNPGEDPYGSKNYWALSGGFSERNIMPGSYPDTYHMINNDELGVANFSQFTGGTIASVNSKNFSSFGPYEFPPQHKLRIIYVVGISGIGFQKAKEIGQKWFSGTLEDPPNMPDPNSGWFPTNFAFPVDATEMDKKKDRWISMGIDSVMTTAWRAKWNYEHDYQIPQAPPPPSTFEIRGTGLQDGVILKWKNPEAELLPNFEGYRILRRLTNQDSVFYEVIYSSGPEDKASEHEFLDTTVLSGAPYYYYLQTKASIDVNDFNADPTTRGKIMYSSRLLIPNLNSVRPPKHSSDDMSQIRIVPNPYNINDPLVRELYGQPGIDGRVINFYNLPPVVTIRIYTENGDLAKTIYHDEPVDENGLKNWDMITDNQQVISSGIYIAVFQKPTGETSYQKFIIIR
ncbi:MAG: hypothetical protein ACHQ1D_03235 [Nitrososphaerales archaeon]